MNGSGRKDEKGGDTSPRPPPFVAPMCFNWGPVGTPPFVSQAIISGCRG